MKVRKVVIPECRSCKYWIRNREEYWKGLCELKKYAQPRWFNDYCGSFKAGEHHE